MQWKNRPLCMLCLLFLLIKYCMILAGGAGGIKELQASPLETYVANQSSVVVRGQVYQKIQKNKYQIIYLKKNEISYLLPADQLPDQTKQSNVNNKNQIKIKEERLLIQDSEFQEIPIGVTIEVTGTVSFFEKDRNPGNFDQKFYYQKQGIHGSIRANQITVLSEKANVLGEWLYKFRLSWKEMLYGVLGEEQGAILVAIMLGDKNGMDPDLSERYQKNGIGHILAISGLHISFIGAGLYKLLRKTGMPYPAAGGIGILFLGTYILMVGLGVSTVRAFLMFFIRIGADITGRVYDSVTSLAVAAAVVVFWRPLYLMDAGFLLSFGALIGIICILPELVQIIPYRHAFLKGLYASISVNLVLLPIQLYYYFEYPPYAIVLNLIVIPLMTVLLGCGIVGSLFWLLFGRIGIWGLTGCKWILLVYDWLCKVCIRLPGARLIIGQPRLWQIIGYYLILLCLLLLCHYRNKCITSNLVRIGYAGFVCMLMIVCIPASSFGIGRNGLKIAMMDVGQGDGIMLRGPTGKTYLIDGGSSDQTQVGKYRMEPYIKSQGIHTLDYVLISHGDMDHISGVQEMIERRSVGVRIRNLVLPVEQMQDEALRKLAKQAHDAGIRVVKIQPGEQLTEGGLTITCLQPDETFPGEIGNESSMILSVKYGKCSMLLTGDCEGSGEKSLLEQTALKEHLILKVAHHGSKNATYEELLLRLKPKYALISAGVNNRYGHPSEETLKRLDKAECEIYSTNQSGAIMIETDGEQMQIKTHTP